MSEKYKHPIKIGNRIVYSPETLPCSHPKNTTKICSRENCPAKREDGSTNWECWDAADVYQCEYMEDGIE